MPVATGVAFVLLLGASVARAEEDACAKFKWPVAVEKQWFAAGAKIKAGPTGNLPAVPDGAVELKLAPPEGVQFVVAPKRKPAETSGNAVISLPPVAIGGAYQVTLSDEAWIDVVQDGAAAPTLDFSGVKGCSGVRKSVRFDLKAGPAIIEISGSPGQTILLAIRRAD
ncbi:MAG: hypothetical protein JSS20_10525 [Proteobacteria bacterium]|nr:hypothetical protein [Pseudomonadota bacterium]